MSCLKRLGMAERWEKLQKNRRFFINHWALNHPRYDFRELRIHNPVVEPFTNGVPSFYFFCTIPLAPAYKILVLPSFFLVVYGMYFSKYTFTFLINSYPFDGFFICSVLADGDIIANLAAVPGYPSG